MTPARIRAVLRAPHRAMPAAALNDTQISDLIAYIATLVAR